MRLLGIIEITAIQIKIPFLALIGPLQCTSTGNLTRGSLPVVIVDSWSEVTPERLAKEWESISSKSPSHWDWRRIFVDHWLERLDASWVRVCFQMSQVLASLPMDMHTLSAAYCDSDLMHSTWIRRMDSIEAANWILHDLSHIRSFSDGMCILKPISSSQKGPSK